MRNVIKSALFTSCLVLVLSTGTANAALLATIPGNDCSGEFGSGFSDCAIPAEYDRDQSPIIAKYDFSDNGAITSTTLNLSLFPSLDGTEFSFNFATNTWTYTPGAGDPVVSFFVAKGGPNFNLFSAEDELSDVWATPLNPNNDQPYDLSHLSFYDTDGGDPGDVPEPATMALVGLGLLGSGLARRRKR